MDIPNPDLLLSGDFLFSMEAVMKVKKIVLSLIFAGIFSSHLAYATSGDEVKSIGSQGSGIGGTGVDDAVVTCGFGIVSDYVFRGITQTSHKPAVQGGIDYEHDSGLYVAAWGSNVSWTKDSNTIASGDANIELDTYLGFRNAFAVDDQFNVVGYDIGYVRYSYLGNYQPKAGFSNADTAEVYAAASFKIVTLKYSYSLLDGFMTVPGTTGTNYIDLSINYPTNDGVTIGAHVGRQTFVGYPFVSNGLSYTDYKLGVTKYLDGYVWGLAYSSTNATATWRFNGEQLGKSTVSLSVLRAF